MEGPKQKAGRSSAPASALIRVPRRRQENSTQLWRRAGLPRARLAALPARLAAGAAGLDALIADRIPHPAQLAELRATNLIANLHLGPARKRKKPRPIGGVARNSTRHCKPPRGRQNSLALILRHVCRAGRLRGAPARVSLRATEVAGGGGAKRARPATCKLAARNHRPLIARIHLAKINDLAAASTWGAHWPAFGAARRLALHNLLCALR